MPSSELTAYWEHAKKWGVPGSELVSESMMDKTHALYLWADDAVYNAAHEKIMVMVLGSIHDEKKHSVETCWPLCTIRVVTCWFNFGNHFGLNFNK